MVIDGGAVCTHQQQTQRMLCSVQSFVRLRHTTNASATLRHLARLNTRLYATRGRPIALEMKRRDPPTKAGSPVKKPKAQVVVPEYHAAPSIKEEDGSIQWPAPKEQMERAREIILDWYIRPVSNQLISV